MSSFRCSFDCNVDVTIWSEGKDIAKDNNEVKTKASQKGFMIILLLLEWDPIRSTVAYLQTLCAQNVRFPMCIWLAITGTVVSSRPFHVLVEPKDSKCIKDRKLCAKELLIWEWGVLVRSVELYEERWLEFWSISVFIVNRFPIRRFVDICFLSSFFVWQVVNQFSNVLHECTASTWNLQPLGFSNMVWHHVPPEKFEMQKLEPEEHKKCSGMRNSRWQAHKISFRTMIVSCHYHLIGSTVVFFVTFFQKTERSYQSTTNEWKHESVNSISWWAGYMQLPRWLHITVPWSTPSNTGWRITIRSTRNSLKDISVYVHLFLNTQY